uniref:Uncharacterized protein n=1 Tax=Anguilla anguilla TaxID=7936 RepID=A0A0E9PNS6_ANGAN
MLVFSSKTGFWLLYYRGPRASFSAGSRWLLR